MVHTDQATVAPEAWRLVGTLIYRKYGPRDAKILPVVFQSNLIKVNFRFLTKNSPVYYKAGWINQVVRVQGGQHLLPGMIVPVQPSIFKFDAGLPSQIRFNPVDYLFDCVILFYRAV